MHKVLEESITRSKNREKSSVLLNLGKNDGIERWSMEGVCESHMKLLSALGFTIVATKAF